MKDGRSNDVIEIAKLLIKEVSHTTYLSTKFKDILSELCPDYDQLSKN